MWIQGRMVFGNSARATMAHGAPSGARPVRLRTIGRYSLCGALFVGALIVACAGPGVEPRPVRRSFGEPTDFRSVTRSATIPRQELRALRSRRDTGARMRLAHLLIEDGRAREAIRPLNSVIFSSPGPSVDIEATARFLRGRAFAVDGDAERAANDHARAAAIARDPNLRRALATLGVQEASSRGPTPQISVRPRAAWNAKRPKKMTALQRVTRMTVHHSAILAQRASEEVIAATIKRIQRFHMDTHEWSDVGYHFIIDPNGRVWEGRNARWKGAHAGGANNRENLGICLLGSFVRGAKGQSPTSEQIAALETLVVQLAAEYGVRPDRLLTHREFVRTECPGDRLHAVVLDMRKRLAAASPP